VQLWYQTRSRLLIPQILSLDVAFGGCQVAKLLTRSRGDFQCSTRVSESSIVPHRVLENS